MFTSKATNETKIKAILLAFVIPVALNAQFLNENRKLNFRLGFVNSVSNFITPYNDIGVILVGYNLSDKPIAFTLQNDISPVYMLGLSQKISPKWSVELSLTNTRLRFNSYAFTLSTLGEGKHVFKSSMAGLGVGYSKKLNTRDHIKVTTTLNFSKIWSSSLYNQGIKSNTHETLTIVRILNRDPFYLSQDLNASYVVKFSERREISFNLNFNIMFKENLYYEAIFKDTLVPIFVEPVTFTSRNFRLNWFSFGIGYSFWQKPKPKVEQ